MPPAAVLTAALRGGKSTEKLGIFCHVRVTWNGK